MMRSLLRLLPFCVPVALSAQGTITVSVFDDRNNNGVRDGGDRPVAGVAISNQRNVRATDASGVVQIERGTGVISVSLPNSYRISGPFWRAASPTDSQLQFALQSAPAARTFSFVHASDTHIAPANVERTRRFKRLVDSIKPDFTIITGDLIRDAMSQTESLSRSYFELFDTETRNFTNRLWTVPGNHDHFGIIRSRSNISETHPMYDREMYRHYLGPDYYSFNYGGVHFVGLNTLMRDDSAYYGRVDSLQLAWLREDLALIPSTTPVVTFNHIPMVSAWETFTGFIDMALVGSVRMDNGRTTHRHTVNNTLEVVRATRPRQWVLALGGHIHTAEKLSLQLGGAPTRFEQAAAIVGGAEFEGVTVQSGITLYNVRDGVIDAGRFIPMDAVRR